MRTEDVIVVGEAARGCSDGDLQRRRQQRTARPDGSRRSIGSRRSRGRRRPARRSAAAAEAAREQVERQLRALRVELDVCAVGDHAPPAAALGALVDLEHHLGFCRIIRVLRPSTDAT